MSVLAGRETFYESINTALTTNHQSTANVTLKNMQRPTRRKLGLLLLAALLCWGCAGPRPGGIDIADSGLDVRRNGGILAGTVLARSDRSGTIAIRTVDGRKGQEMKIFFDDTTQGIGFAGPDHRVVIVWQMRGGRPHALEIRPEPISLPTGVRSISVEEVREHLAAGDDVVLVDTRAEKRFLRSHLPGAVSIPDGRLAQFINRLPADRGRSLIFYGEGPT